MIHDVIGIAEYGASKYVRTGLWGNFGDAVFSLSEAHRTID